MTVAPVPTGSRRNVERRAERLLEASSRKLDVVCALLLGALAGFLLYDFVIRRWFYFNFHQYYRWSYGYEWTRSICDLVIGVWCVGLALDLYRGSSRRRDGGLFAPTALRVWGVVFGAMPFVLLLASPHAALHLFLWCWSAATACFILAARRSRGQLGTDPAAPIE